MVLFQNLLCKLRPAASLLAALSLLTAAGCGDDDPPPPTADAIFLNQLGGRGNVDLYIDGQVETTLALGTLSNPVEIDTGSHTLSFLVSGSSATQPFLTQAFDFRDQTYIFILYEDETGDEAIRTVGDDAPETLAEGMSAVQVFSLFESTTPLDLYARAGSAGEPTLIAEDVTYLDKGAFVSVPSGPTQILVFSADAPATGIPIIDPFSIELTSGESTILVVEPSAQGSPRPALNSIPL